MAVEAYINRIATATPKNDVHRAFVDYADEMLNENRIRQLFRRMSRMSAIDHRFSCLRPVMTSEGHWEDADGFYVRGSFPSTARRMQMFERSAPALAHCALDRLTLTPAERERHACCRDVLHRALCSGPRFRNCGLSRFEPVSGANHDRIHGLLRGD